MPKKQDKSQNIKTYKELSQGEQPFAGFKTGEQLPLFEMPPTSASLAISQGLPRLQKLLFEQGIEIGNFDDLYTAAVSIVRFVAAKEKQAILVKRQENKNGE